MGTASVGYSIGIVDRSDVKFSALPQKMEILCSNFAPRVEISRSILCPTSLSTFRSKVLTDFLIVFTFFAFTWSTALLAF